ncbi:MAG TPA: hypothetical protein VK194_03630, partial [Candidatus Deferrimicrobium sp.]|nr:hypothetical protein [Candidatus Deferrimicrobium sp.]
TNVYEMRVGRATRADLGIWHRRLDTDAPADRLLAPAPPDARFGRTFSTEFTWGLAGDRLAIQSCGEVACRTRVVAPGGGPVQMLDAPGLGLLVGLDGDRVVTYAACRGLPCPIISTDIVTGDRRVLAVAAGLATIVASPDGSRLVHESRPVPGAPIRSTLLDGGAAADLDPTAPGLRLGAIPVVGDTAVRLPPGWILLTPDGTNPTDLTDHRSQLRRIPDGATVELDEAVR